MHGYYAIQTIAYHKRNQKTTLDRKLEFKYSYFKSRPKGWIGVPVRKSENVFKNGYNSPPHGHPVSINVPEAKEKSKEKIEKKCKNKYNKIQ